jgi:hypothetical protein
MTSPHRRSHRYDTLNLVVTFLIAHPKDIDFSQQSLNGRSLAALRRYNAAIELLEKGQVRPKSLNFLPFASFLAFSSAGEYFRFPEPEAYFFCRLCTL